MFKTRWGWVAYTTVLGAVGACAPEHRLRQGDAGLIGDAAAPQSDGGATTIDATPDAAAGADAAGDARVPECRIDADCPAGYCEAGVCVAAVDECALSETDCGGGACINRLRGYLCACPSAGYAHAEQREDSPCVDIDECATGAHPCDTDPPACVNLEGNAGQYDCRCPAGFLGIGQGADGCRPPTWQRSVKLGGAPGSSLSGVRLRIGPSGDAVVAWVERDQSSSTQTIRASRGRAASAWSAWSAPATVRQANGTLSLEAVGVAADGVAVALWRDYVVSPKNTAFLSARWPLDSAAWGAYQLVTQSSLGAGKPTSPALAVAHGGDAVCVFDDPASPGLPGVARFSSASNEWTSDGSLGVDDAVPLADLRVGQAARPVAVWTEGTSELVASHWFPSAGWAPERRIDLVNGTAVTNPVLAEAADGSGDVMLLWLQADGGEANLYARRWDAALGDWLTTREVDVLDDAIAGMSQLSAPTVAVGDPSGGFHVVWAQAGSVWISTYSVQGDVWTAPGPVVAGAVERPMVAVVGNGDFVVAYVDTSTDIGRAMAVHYSAYYARWGVPVDLQPDVLTEPTFLDSLASDQAGHAVAVWHSSAPAGDPEVWAARFE